MNGARISAYSFKIQLVIPSGPVTFRGFSLDKADRIAGSETISGAESSLLGSIHSSLENDVIGSRN